MFPFEFLRNFFLKEKEMEENTEDKNSIQLPFDILNSYSWLP